MLRAPLLPLLLLALLALLAGARADRYHPDPTPELLAAAPRARPSPAELTAAHWHAEARAALEQHVRAGRAAGGGRARNVLLFMGDGMSVPTLAAARALLGQRRNATGEEAQLSFETFPTVGLAKTYCVNAQVADSACTASAYLCGVKANQGTLGVSAAVPRGDCAASQEASARLQSVAAWALADGRDAGIVTSTRITHASPAGAYAVSANRDWENDAQVRADGHDPGMCPDIAYQLIKSSPGNQFKVILGGGRRELLPTDVVDEEGQHGHRTDNRHLIDEWRTNKAALNVSHQYIWNRDQLLAANASLPDYLLGLFESNHLQYNLLRDPRTEPTLAELTEVAVRSLSRNERGFFLFVEGGRIDHAHHDNNAQLALDETIEFARAVERAAELLDERDSLIVVTADHAHVMSFNGYSPRGTNVLGPVGGRDRDGQPYMTLSYTNGPGFRAHEDGQRPDVTAEEEFGSAKWRAHVDVPLRSETHGADDVAVFARGPHHAVFSGLFEQSGVPHRLAFAGCFGPGLHACSAATQAPRPALTVPLALALATLLARRADSH